MESGGGCSMTEPFALRVVGDSMAPEFEDGKIIIIDPGMPLVDGMYVIMDFQGETVFRQYIERDGRKFLHPLNEGYDDQELVGPYFSRGVVIQRAGRRRDGVKHYEYHEELLRAHRAAVESKTGGSAG